MQDYEFTAHEGVGDGKDVNHRDICTITIPEEIGDLFTNDDLAEYTERMLDIWREAYYSKLNS